MFLPMLWLWLSVAVAPALVLSCSGPLLIVWWWLWPLEGTEKPQKPCEWLWGFGVSAYHSAVCLGCGGSVVGSGMYSNRSHGWQWRSPQSLSSSCHDGSLRSLIF